MRFTPAFLDEIRARLPLSEVVRRRVRLVKSGREWKGLSPFNSEKTPSFFVNDQKMAWFDFSSGKNGNIFDFVMATEGLAFPEAVARLAQDAGLQVPAPSPEVQAQDKRRATLHEVLNEATQFFEAQLQGRIGVKARAYLDDRQLALETRRAFRLGYAPAEKYALRDALAAKGADVDTMCEAGLLIHGPDIVVPYDRFRDRIMFPICDRSGRVIAFGGRALDTEAPAKYLNSPETPLFHKGAILYNHHNARKAAHERGTVIAVEGYVDAIAMSAAGFPHTVAPLGTALTADQCELLWKMAEEPILCFDGDKAGRKAAYRAIDVALPLLGPGKSLRFALLPDGQDPDDLARTGGAPAIEATLARARPLVDVIWRRETEARALDTPERKAALERRLAEIARDIADDKLRRYYEADFRARLAALFAPAAGRAARPMPWRRDGPRGGRGAPPRAWGPDPSLGQRDTPPAVSADLAASALFRTTLPALSPREALILLLLVNHPVLLDDYAEEIAELEFAGHDALALREKLLHLTGDPLASPAAVKAELNAAGCGPLLARLEAGPAQAAHWYARPEAATEDAEQVLKQALALHRKARALHRELQLAERALGNDANELNLARLRDIQEQIAALAGTEATVEGFGDLSGRASGTI